MIFRIFISYSLTWDSMEAKTSKRYSSLKSCLNFSNFTWSFFSLAFTKVPFLDFLNIEFTIFHDFFLFSLTWDPMGAKTPKPYYYLRSLLNFFKLLNFLINDRHKSTVLDFWIFYFTVFFEIFFLKKFNFHHCVIWGIKKLLLPWKGVIVERNGVKFGHLWQVFSVYMVHLTVKCSRSVWGHSVHFWFSASFYLANGWS